LCFSELKELKELKAELDRKIKVFAKESEIATKVSKTQIKALIFLTD
jgi:hypothetical protein